MAGNIFTTLFFGMIFILVPDAIFFTGIMKNYINYYDIEIYFNQLFLDNQSFILYFLLSIVIGYGLMFASKTKKYFFVFYMLLVVISITSLDRDRGREYGEKLFLQEDVRLKTQKSEEIVDILYIGREILFYKKRNRLDALIIRKDEVLNLEDFM